MNLKKLKITISYEDQDGNELEASPVQWEVEADTTIEFNISFERHIEHVRDTFDRILQTEITGLDSFQLTATRQGPRKVLPSAKTSTAAELEAAGFKPVDLEKI